MGADPSAGERSIRPVPVRLVIGNGFFPEPVAVTVSGALLFELAVVAAAVTTLRLISVASLGSGAPMAG